MNIAVPFDHTIRPPSEPFDASQEQGILFDSTLKRIVERRGRGQAWLSQLLPLKNMKNIAGRDCPRT
jgi:hypothetical protein